MAELLKLLSETNGVSGNEHGVRELILEHIRDKCDEITIDTMGNIIALKRGLESGRRIAAAANMDEPGLILSGITDGGYIKFKSVGSVDPRKLVSKRVVIGDNKVCGVIGMKAIHLQTREERDNVIKVKDLYIDIGAKDKEDAKKTVKPGDYIAFDTKFALLGNGNVKGKALDRSGPCLALINSLEGSYPHDFYACFLVQHETGARGAAIAAHRVKPDVILNIASCEASDIYGMSRGGLPLGGGAKLSFADKRLIADRELTRRLSELAGAGTFAAMDYASDGGAMQLVGTRALSALLACRYSHSPVSIMNMGDIESLEKIIKMYLSKIGDIV